MMTRMRNAIRWTMVWAMVWAAGATGGCPQVQHGALPSRVFQRTEASTGRSYWMYVPSTYQAGRPWPLLVTLHGTYGYDWAVEQAKEWDSVAEKSGFIVVAPALNSVQGILPVPREARRAQLAADDQAIMAIIDEVCAAYSIDPKAILLTGFSAGGFPLWNTGLKHPERFCMLISRNCNLDMALIREIPFTETTRKLPVKIYWGKDDVKLIRDQGWEMLEFMRRQRQCYLVTHKKIAGGHFRNPDRAYEFWQEHMPEQYRVKKGHWPPSPLSPAVVGPAVEAPAPLAAVVASPASAPAPAVEAPEEPMPPRE